MARKKTTRILKQGQQHLTHGARSWTATGKLPDVRWAKAIKAKLNTLESDLFLAVEDVHGRPPSVQQAAFITSAVRHEGAHRLMLNWLSENEDTLDVEKKASLLYRANVESDKRDAAIEKLKLDSEPRETVDYSQAWEQRPQIARNGHENATDKQSNTIDVNGNGAVLVQPSASEGGRT